MSTYTITNPTDIFSLIMNVYGTLEESMQLLSDNNTIISSLETDISELAGQQLYFNPALVVTWLPPQPVLSTFPAPVTEFTWVGMEGQNLFDVCIQTYGILDDLIMLMNDNNVTWLNNLGEPFDVYKQPFIYDSSMIASSTVWNRTTGMGVVFSTGN
jgi:hypothetical protein